jgi:RNA polymerase sigma-70 factor (ECF subfamily)
VTQTEPGPELVRLDQAAVARVVRGEAEALRELYARYGRMVYALAYALLRENQLAEECVQDVFVELWRHAARYDPSRGRVAAWLCTIARNRAIDLARARERRAVPSDSIELAGSEPDSALLVARAERATRVVEAMAVLPAAQHEVVQLLYFEGLSQSEVAARLGLPLGTVKSRLRLALDRLRPLADDLRGGEVP